MILQVISQSNNDQLIVPEAVEVTTNNEGHYSLMFAHAQYNSTAFYKNGYTVFAIMNQREDNHRQITYLYNHTTGVLTSADWGDYVSGDYHSTATMRFLDDGRIVSFSPAAHNDDIEIKISDNPYDITTYSISTEINTTSPAYPNITKIGTRYYCFTRGFSQKNFICWSDDDCETFTEPQQVCELLYAGKWAYPRGIYSTDKIRVCVAQRNQDSGGVYSNLYYLESSDGNNWNNITGSFSKNVSTSGFITSAEMDANCLIENSGFVGGVAMKNDTEIIYHVDNAIHYTDSGSVISIPLISPYYSQILVNNKSQLLKKSENEWYLLCKGTSVEDSENYLIIIHTTDLFENIEVARLFDGQDFFTPLTSYNFEDGIEPLILALQHKVYGSGDVIDPFNSYSDFSYISNMQL